MAVHKRRIEFVKDLFSKLNGRLTPGSIVDNLNSTNKQKVLSAKQGGVLRQMINDLVLSAGAFDPSRVKYQMESLLLTDSVGELTYAPLGGQVLFGVGYASSNSGSGEKAVTVNGTAISLVVPNNKDKGIDVHYYYYDVS